MVDWKSVQTKLITAGRDPGLPDGVAGPKTFKALFDYAAGTDLKDVGAALGASMASNFIQYEFTTAPRVGELIAETGHESAGFTVFRENLYYSTPQRLCAVWPSRFPTVASATPFAKNPQALANKVYCGRMGNTGSNDGWLYAGKGLLQLTGKSNYDLYGRALNIDLVGNPDLAADPATSLVIAMEFFKRGGINALVDAGKFTDARKAINGGTVGVDDVAARRAKVMGLLA